MLACSLIFQNQKVVSAAELTLPVILGVATAETLVLVATTAVGSTL